MDTIELRLAHDCSLQVLKRMQGWEFWRLLLSHVPDVQIAFY